MYLQIVKWVWVLSRNFQRILKEEDQMTNRQCVDDTAKTKTTAIATPTTSSISTTTRGKSTKMQVSGSVAREIKLNEYTG